MSRTGRPLVDITGQRFGRLIVIEREGSQGHNPVWKCICDCSKTHLVLGTNLKRGHVSSCGCLVKIDHSIANLNNLLRSYKYRAQRKNQTYELSDEEAIRLFKNDCHYCGSKPANIFLHKSTNKKAFVYNGIDRIDNSKGYSVDNVVSCCGMCNSMKRDYTYQAFMEQVEQIYKNRTR